MALAGARALERLLERGVELPALAEALVEVAVDHDILEVAAGEAELGKGRPLALVRGEDERATAAAHARAMARPGECGARSDGMDGGRSVVGGSGVHCVCLRAAR